MEEQSKNPIKRADLRIILPTLLAVALFIISIFVIIIPAFRSNMMDRKREMIRELTNSAWSVMQEYHEEEKKGSLTREEAQKRAISDIRFLRYGEERKDYFWITDMQPRMVMHPYKPQLDGKDLSGKEGEDPTGKKLFVDMVKVCKASGSGFVEYMWQWKDDPTRIVPKLSYVKGFRSWGWIIGTGIYIEDVKEEIAGMAGRLVTVSIIIIVIIALLLFYITQQSLKIEGQRILAEQGLRESERKYRVMVEAAKEGTMMVMEGKYIYSNQSIQDMLGYTGEEFKTLDLYDIIVDGEEVSPGSGFETFKKILTGEQAPTPFEARLKKKNSDPVDVELTISRITLDNDRGYIIIARDISRSKLKEEEYNRSRENLIVELQSSQLFFNRPIKHFLHEEVSRCPMSMSIRKAAAIMTKHKYSAILVTDDEVSTDETSSSEPRYIGMLTDRDIRRRVVAEGIDIEGPVYEVMSSPLISIPDSALVFEAMLLMQENAVRHLAVKDHSGRVVSLISDQQLIHLQRSSSSYIIKEIHEAEMVDDIVYTHKRLPRMAKSLIDSGANAKNMCRIFTAVSDAIVERLIGFAIEELGPPPVAFAFVALGSEGREEQTLVTDQDNAIIYEDVADQELSRQAATYFSKLGEKVCLWLDVCGYQLCKGDIMAKNPKWCQTLSGWKNHFKGWIEAAEPQDLLEVNIFFDFRCVYGKKDLTDQLHAHIRELLSQRPAFFQFIARNALLYKPPLGFFGNIVVDSSGEKPSTFDIKESIKPIVNYARLYTLKHNIPETNTLERLFNLYTRDVLTRSNYDEMVKVYDYLMQMRFKHQATALNENREPDNSINPKQLTDIEHTLLKNTFTQINNFQKRLSYDFIGTASF
jgi:PAS domain S-box-containing protein